MLLLTFFKSVFEPNTDYGKNDEFKGNCVGDLVKIDRVIYDNVR
ncbi:hypothetical protein AVEN_84046-1, partial [Araneus ventricosus]